MAIDNVDLVAVVNDRVQEAAVAVVDIDTDFESVHDVADAVEFVGVVELVDVVAVVVDRLVVYLVENGN